MLQVDLPPPALHLLVSAANSCILPDPRRDWYAFPELWGQLYACGCYGGMKRSGFVCSFTSSLQDGFDPGDRLSQWRGYSRSSQGFSLGFEKEPLKKQVAIDNPGAKASVLECIYEDTGAEFSFFQEMGHNAAARVIRLSRYRAADS